MYNIIIAGGRDLKDYEFVRRNILLRIRNIKEDIEIVSGGAKGADKLGEMFAKQYNLPLKKFLADWDNNGKAAGPIRNKEMALYARAAIVFWDGKSKGSENMIDTAINCNLRLWVVRYGS